ncbi:PhnD/SsuA/transferrin family substrate-binding protein [Xanthobacter sp. DSM 24535]|uniref:PhnD/SsuA/transferrin family substrate-binding protein n=1 Tax=Roseixanthobacter psychrophilus TaxID=3119917 RepID=UPI0037261CEF
MGRDNPQENVSLTKPCPHQGPAGRSTLSPIELTSRVAILRRSEWLGFPPIAASRHPADLQAFAALTEAFSRMNEDEDGQAVLAMLRLDGFVPLEASLFDPIAAKAALVAGTG